MNLRSVGRRDWVRIEKNARVTFSFDLSFAFTGLYGKFSLCLSIDGFFMYFCCLRWNVRVLIFISGRIRFGLFLRLLFLLLACACDASGVFSVIFLEILGEIWKLHVFSCLRWYVQGSDRHARLILLYMMFMARIMFCLLSRLFLLYDYHNNGMQMEDFFIIFLEMFLLN